MHWSVGMLLHAVCVCFSRSKRYLLRMDWAVPSCFSSQHGAVDSGWHSIHSLFYRPSCFDLKQTMGFLLLTLHYLPLPLFISVLVCFFYIQSYGNINGVLIALGPTWCALYSVLMYRWQCFVWDFGKYLTR